MFHHRFRLRQALFGTGAVLCASFVLAPVLWSQGPASGLPLVRNAGQWDTPARLVGRQGPYTVRFEPDAIWIQIDDRSSEPGRPSHLIRLGLDLPGDAAVHGEGVLPGAHNYFLGSDPDGWRTGVERYRRAVYATSTPILTFGCRAGERLEIRLEAGPSIGDDGRVLVVEGADSLAETPDGALMLRTPLEDVRITVLGARIQREGSAQVRLVPGSGGASVDRGSAAQSSTEAVTDPAIEWSSFLGSPGLDFASDVEVDVSGTITVGGNTDSPEFPTTPGPLHAFGPQFGTLEYDGFVTRIDPSTSQLVFSSFFGGNMDDFVIDLALLPTGDTAVAGSTESADFPVTEGAYATSKAANRDGFIARLGPLGDELAFSTFLGTSSSDNVVRIAVHATEELTVIGNTTGSSFPTTPGAFEEGPLPQGPGFVPDGFITKLTSDGSALVWSTLLGGSDLDLPGSICLLEDGSVLVTGATASVDFPITAGTLGSPPSAPSERDVFVSILSPDGSSLIASTCFGGDTAFQADSGGAASVDSAGSIYVAGNTDSPDFPVTAGAFEEVFSGTDMMFVARLDPTLSTLEYSTLFGGAANLFQSQSLSSFEVDASGVATLAGRSNTSSFPTTPGAYASGANPSIFLSRLSPQGDRLFYSSRFEDFGGSALQLHSLGSTTIVGFTNSPGYPVTPDAYDTTFNGGSEVFITRFSMLPTGVLRFGGSKPSCLGDVAMGVTKMAVSGDSTFGLTCSAAPPLSSGFLVLGFGPDPNGGLVLPQFTFLLDVSKPLVAILDTSDAAGYAELDLPLPPGTAGIEFFTQYVWVNTATCGGLGTLSSSNALAVTVQ